MKKVLASILAVIYLSTSMGATIHFHYCMGQLIGWGFVDHDSKACSVCGMQKADSNKQGITAKKGCCHDEHRIIRNDKDQKSSQSEFRFSKLVADRTATSYRSAGTWKCSLIADYPTANAPPGSVSNPVYLLNRNFRI